MPCSGSVRIVRRLRKFADEPRPGCYTAAPNNRQMNAVSTSANAPQNVTRTAPRITLAPLVRAAIPPRRAKDMSEVAETRTVVRDDGPIEATRSGRAAPTAKVAADANAAWTGRVACRRKYPAHPARARRGRHVPSTVPRPDARDRSQVLAGRKSTAARRFRRRGPLRTPTARAQDPHSPYQPVS